MKLFENKELDIKVFVDPTKENSPTKQGTRASLVIQALQAPRQEGFSIEEMKKRFRIIDALEPIADKSGGSAKLEDADAEHLKSIMKNYNWMMVHRDIVDLQDHINDLKNVKK